MSGPSGNNTSNPVSVTNLFFPISHPEAHFLFLKIVILLFPLCPPQPQSEVSLFFFFFATMFPLLPVLLSWNLYSFPILVLVLALNSFHTLKGKHDHHHGNQVTNSEGCCISVCMLRCQVMLYVSVCKALWACWDIKVEKSAGRDCDGNNIIRPPGNKYCTRKHRNKHACTVTQNQEWKKKKTLKNS